MADVTPQTAVTTVEKEIQKMIESVQELPEKTIRWNPTPDEWSIMQIITHVAEALPYWVDEIKKIIQDPHVTWGRGLTDEVRLQTVSEENVNRLAVEEVIEKLKTVPETVAQTVGTLTEEQLTIVAPCRNPRFNGKPVQFIIDHLIVEHVEKHNGQIQRNLSKRK